MKDCEKLYKSFAWSQGCVKLRLSLRSFLWCGNARKSLCCCDQLTHLLCCCLLGAQRFSNTSLRAKLMLKFSCTTCPDNLLVSNLINKIMGTGKKKWYQTEPRFYLLLFGGGKKLYCFDKKRISYFHPATSSQWFHVIFVQKFPPICVFSF